MIRRHPRSTRTDTSFPYPTLVRSAAIRPEWKCPGLRAKDIVRTVRSGTPGFAPMLVRDLPRCHSWSFLAATVDALQPGCESHLRRISAPTLIVCEIGRAHV